MRKASLQSGLVACVIAALAYAIGTPDESVSGPVLKFIRAHSSAAAVR